MKTKIFLCSLISLFALACDHIDENERLIYVEPETVQRTVLLEDFTGQQCVNCPKGTEVIEQLQQAYGDGIIAVGIHGGPLGFKGNAKTLGLATDLGDEYYHHWNLEYQPVGLVDRHGAVNYTDWMTKVREEIAKTSSVSMALDATLSGDQLTIRVKATSLDGTFDGKLQVWVLEDSITATQKMPDNTSNKEYVHNHVLRTAVNGTWGEAVALAASEPKTLTYQQPVDATWNAAHLSIVAFVYNDNGVEQAIRKEVK